MKRFLTIAVLTFLAATCAHAQDIAGDWQGTIKTAMGELRLVLHVTKNADGTLKASIDSPDQNAAGIAIESIALEGNKLRFASAPLKATYEGTLKGSDSINGNWTQGQSFLSISRRRQTPSRLCTNPHLRPILTASGKARSTWAQGKLRIVFRVTNTEDGLMAAMDSPDQKVTGMPSTSVSRKGSSIKIEMKQISGYFQGKIDKNMDGMSGDWNQGGSGTPLQLKRAKDEPAAVGH